MAGTSSSADRPFDAPPPRAPSLCPATIPLTARASANGIQNRQKPPPTALATASNRLFTSLPPPPPFVQEADELAGPGRGKCPNGPMPRPKRRRVVPWDALGLGPMMEATDLRGTSDVDLGGGGGGGRDLLLFSFRQRGGGTENQNGADGRACAWEAATIKGMAWPANPVATGCQGNPCSTGIRWGLSPAAQMGCLRNRSGSPSGADQP